MTQFSINFDKTLSKTLTDAGIKKAVDSANQLHDNWSEKAYDYMKAFVKSRKPGEEFMTEDIRQDAYTIVPVPRSDRAWGAITRRAIYEGLIRKVGYRHVRNAKAHHANAAVFVRNF